MARSQAELIERLVADEPATVVSGGELEGQSVVVDARVPVASTAALVALKTVPMVRRPHGNSRHSRLPTPLRFRTGREKPL